MLQVSRRGTVVAHAAEGVVIEFPSQRCKNCTCSFSGSTNNPSADNQRFSFTPSQATAADTFQVGQSVNLSVPVARLRLVTAILFGAPVVGALASVALSSVTAMEPITQGLTAIGGFAGGMALSYRYRQNLKQVFYNRLSISPLDC